MGLFKLKKNKRFNYKPRFYKGVGNPFELKHKFEDQRTTVEKNNLKKTFKVALNDLKSYDIKSLRIIIIVSFLLSLLFLFIIEFDLTIFIK
ncbi:MAG: riboflavin synthase subunit beta [Flavobacteriaceae bacterium]